MLFYKSFDVITIGAATLDVFLKSKSFQLVKGKQFRTGLGECFTLGSKVEVDQLVVATGGGATNSAVTFARLGFKTGCLTRVGTDLFGQTVRHDLARESIACDLVVVTKKDHTAYSNILMVPEGERTVLVYRGASHHFYPKDITWSAMKAPWWYVTSVAGHLDFLQVLLTHAHQKKIKVVYNPGGVEIAKGRRLFSYLAQCEIVNMNGEEARSLLGSRVTPRAAARRLGQMIGNTILITDGIRGAYAYHAGKLFFVATTGIKPISTTGAGDAFGSGMLAGLIKKNDITYGLKLGIINAESVIRHLGAKDGIVRTWPTMSQLAKIKVTVL